MSQPHGSQPSVSQSVGSQPLGSQQSVSQPLAIRAAMSQSQGSHLSSSATPPIGGLRLRDNSSDPPTPSTHASDTHVLDDDADAATASDEEVHYDQYGRIIIVPEGDGFLPSNITTRIITKATRKLYDAPYASWREFPFSLKEAIFNEFKV
uniref:Uncharacterized protein LOC104231891 n=1 Tax=Nicotiana sylvestris TaxID=4096 RepID=A0A1U7X9Y0_NICSY|nr:PREDICTED: uncharacterized protein LOC104231891 [Nicotiana sylvestris]